MVKPQFTAQVSASFFSFKSWRVGNFPLLIIGLCLGLMVNNLSFADDISLVRGFYKKDSQKIEGTSVASETQFELGARFHQDIGEGFAWYALGVLGNRSYTGAAGRKAPDNAVTIQAGGGVRYYFSPFTQGLVPYVSGGGDVRSLKTARFSTSGYESDHLSGLFYEGALGLRVGLDSQFYVEAELPFADSPLFAVNKRVTYREAEGTNPASKSEEEQTLNALWVDTTANIGSIRFAIGYVF
jgi:hypothetical protein